MEQVINSRYKLKDILCLANKLGLSNINTLQTQMGTLYTDKLYNLLTLIFRIYFLFTESSQRLSLQVVSSMFLDNDCICRHTKHCIQGAKTSNTFRKRVTNSENHQVSNSSLTLLRSKWYCFAACSNPWSKVKTAWTILYIVTTTYNHCLVND